MLPTTRPLISAQSKRGKTRPSDQLSDQLLCLHAWLLRRVVVVHTRVSGRRARGTKDCGSHHPINSIPVYCSHLPFPPTSTHSTEARRFSIQPKDRRPSSFFLSTTTINFALSSRLQHSLLNTTLVTPFRLVLTTSYAVSVFVKIPSISNS